jgi:DNA-binding MarR family transcriptional regulator
MAKAGKAGGELKRSPIHLLHRALQLGLDFYNQEAGTLGVTQRQYAVLCAVAAEDGLSQTQLVRVTGIDRSTVAELVARMSGLGLLARQRAAGDGRTNVVRLTEKGRALLESSGPKVAAADKRLLKLLPGKKREAFVELLQDVIRAGGTAPQPEAAKVEPDPGEKKTRKVKPKAEPAAEGEKV